MQEDVSLYLNLEQHSTAQAQHGAQPCIYCLPVSVAPTLHTIHSILLKVPLHLLACQACLVTGTAEKPRKSPGVFDFFSLLTHSHKILNCSFTCYTNKPVEFKLGLKVRVLSSTVNQLYTTYRLAYLRTSFFRQPVYVSAWIVGLFKDCLSSPLGIN